MRVFDVEVDEQEVLVGTKGPGGFSQEVQVFGTRLFSFPKPTGLFATGEDLVVLGR